MRLEGQPARAAFLRRLNRFAVEVERDVTKAESEDDAA
jgi:DNA-binding sugar fermentation-stimulating protein